jgi:hypothetical protein
MRIHSLDAPDAQGPGIASATVELIETDPTEVLPNVLWANRFKPAPGMDPIRAMRSGINCIACVLMLLVHTEPGLTDTGHDFVTRVYVGNAGANR